MRGTDSSFLGTGWTFPPTFTRAGYRVEMASGERDIRESLWVLFSTTPGERLMVPRYGCTLWEMVFRAIDTGLMTDLEDAVAVAILDWEPRIDVVEVKVQPDATVDGKVLVSVEYVVRQTNSRSNLVYPFYVEEGTLTAEAP